VEINSVLFGRKRFERHNVRAILLREVEPSTARFEVFSRDGSRFCVDRFEVRKDGLVFEQVPWPHYTLAATQLAQIKSLHD